MRSHDRLTIVDDGYGNRIQTRKVQRFLARNPRGFVVGASGGQGAGAPATTSASEVTIPSPSSEEALNILTVSQLHELAKERGVGVPDSPKAEIVKVLLEAGVEAPKGEENKED